MTKIDPCSHRIHSQNPQKKVRSKFTPHEDLNLKILVSYIGYNWVKISQFMPGRNAKQCRDRYCNYLSEPHTNEKWNPEEDRILLTFLTIIGTKWVEISRHIPGRSGNDVKNRWHKHLSKVYTFINGEVFMRSYVENQNNFSRELNNDDSKKDETFQKYTISSLLIQ